MAGRGIAFAAGDGAPATKMPSEPLEGSRTKNAPGHDERTRNETKDDMTDDCQKRRALVTGGAQGIGWAICRTLAARGYRIALADIDARSAEERVAELGDGHVALSVDLTDRAAALALPGRAASTLGGLDAIVNNAGMTDSSGLPLTRLPKTSFDRVVALNLEAVEAICSQAGDIVGAGGRIVNLASGAAFRPLALRGPYSATKAGIVALTKALAPELAPKGISVSAVAPGYTRTPLVDALAREGRVDLDKVSASIPMGRIAEPEDIASVAAFLASAESHALSGETIVVDGGGLIGPAPAAVSPEPGKGGAGRILAIGHPQWPNDAFCNKIIDIEQFFCHGDEPPVSSVIDLTGLAPRSGAASDLDQMLRTAKFCAGLSSRSKEFAVLFVFRERHGPRDAATVAAQAMLARTLALEWAPAGMRVNALVWSGEALDGLEEVSRFLVGRDAGFVTGQAIHAGTFE